MTTERITFLTDLKAAGNIYLAHPLTRFKNKFNQSSSESQILALALSQLNPSDPQALVVAVQAIVQYIHAKNSYENKRRFWNNYIFPLIVNLARSPLEDLPASIKSQLQAIEYVSPPVAGTDFTHDSIRLFFDGMGYGRTPVERHPTLQDRLDSPEGCEEIAKWVRNPNSPLHPYGSRILAYFFLQTNGPAPARVKLLIDACLANPSPKGLLIILKAIRHQHPSTKMVLPDLLQALANTHVPYSTNIFGVTEADYTAEEIVDFQTDKIECLRELKRLGLGAISASQLRSLVTSVPAYFDQIPPLHSVIVREILANPVWCDALQHTSSPIHLCNLLEPSVYPEFYQVMEGQKYAKLKAH